MKRRMVNITWRLHQRIMNINWLKERKLLTRNGEKKSRWAAEILGLTGRKLTNIRKQTIERTRRT